MSRVVKLAVIPGDGIGPEVVAQAEKALEAVTAASAVVFEKTRFSLGAAWFLETGDTLTDVDLDAIHFHDAILLDAVGGAPRDPRLKDANIERGLLLRLRFELDHYVNLRPSKLYPGATGPLADPGDIDFVVVREGTEGPYVGNGRQHPPGDAAGGGERDQRKHRLRGRARGALRVRARRAPQAEAHARAQDQRARARGVDLEADRRRGGAGAPRGGHYLHVEAATIFLVTHPSRFDVIVTDNLFGDILTDLAGAVTGGIGLAASGNINPDGAFPSMFKPVHGSAPDIVGQHKADPTAAILSVSVLLDHLGLRDGAARLQRALEEDIAGRSGGQRTTDQIGDTIIARLSAA